MLIIGLRANKKMAKIDILFTIIFLLLSTFAMYGMIRNLSSKNGSKIRRFVLSFTLFCFYMLSACFYFSFGLNVPLFFVLNFMLSIVCVVMVQKQKK